jgi:hypothetical protein
MNLIHILRTPRRLTSVALAGVLLTGGVVACEGAAEPESRPGTISVRAYVDRDASGSFTAGDSALAGVEIQADREDGGVSAMVVTDAQGVARFPDMAPSVYRLSAVGQLPVGATLASNPTPTAAVAFVGDTARAEFRFVFFPGTVTGRVFREDNGTAGYQNPGDTPGAGLRVELLADSADAAGNPIPSNKVVATTTTDANGAYTFNLVKLGNYFVRIENPTTISFGAAGNTRRVTVAPAQSATVAGTTFTGSLVLTIAQARAKPLASVVAVEGVVSAPPGPFATTNNRSEIWVQDATGGIAVFAAPTDLAPSYAVGTRVRVSGILGSNAGQLQISVPQQAVGNPPPAQLEILTGTGTVTPIAVTGTQVNALGTQEGRLVQLSGFQVTTVGGASATSGAFNVTGTTPDGQTVTLRVAGAIPNGAPNTGLRVTDFVVGNRYTVTGILTRFVTGNPAVTTAQIKPRFTTDVVLEASSPARLVINELMPDPRVASDATGEFIEIHNAGGTAANLQGYTIVDAANNSHTIASSVPVAPGGYALLAVSNTAANFGGRTPDYVYPSTVSLNNGTDLLKLLDQGNAVVDSVRYVTITTGRSWSLQNPALENADVSATTNWQLGTTTYNTLATNPSVIDQGTPGAQNDGYVAPALPSVPPTASAFHRAPKRGPLASTARE